MVGRERERKKGRERERERRDGTQPGGRRGKECRRINGRSE